MKRAPPVINTFLMFLVFVFLKLPLVCEELLVVCNPFDQFSYAFSWKDVRGHSSFSLAFLMSEVYIFGLMGQVIEAYVGFPACVFFVEFEDLEEGYKVFLDPPPMLKTLNFLFRS